MVVLKCIVENLGFKMVCDVMCICICYRVYILYMYVVGVVLYV